MIQIVFNEINNLRDYIPLLLIHCIFGVIDSDILPRPLTSLIDYRYIVVGVVTVK